MVTHHVGCKTLRLCFPFVANFYTMILYSLFSILLLYAS